jgi:Flp pilus assembly pilin Flp
MNRIFSATWRWMRRINSGGQRGASAAEYALIIALVGIVVAVGLQKLGGTARDKILEAEAAMGDE